MYSISKYKGKVIIESPWAVTSEPPPDPESDTDLEEWQSNHSLAKERKHECRPLKLNEVRLLVLNPGLPGEPIECFLEHYPLDRAKPYKALFYVWGDTQDSAFIQVDGCSFKVTKNLKDFLVSYRSNDRCAVLWIDAVCINQNDIPERNAQIRLMKRVYEGAEST